MWKPISEAPHTGTKVLGRDINGEQNFTWFECGEWCYNGLFSDADGECYECDDVWEPIEFDIDFK